MRTVLLIVLLLASGAVSAQLIYPAYGDSVFLTQNVIELEGVGEYQGSAIRREFSNTLVFGGFIDTDMKDRSLSHHEEINRFGGNATTEIRYIHGKGRLFGRDSLTWMVKAGYTAIGNLNYGKDVFGLAFYGNTAYLNNTAILTNTSFDFAAFQKIGFALVSKKNSSSVTLNLINVQHYADGVIRKGELKQNEDASQLDLLLNGNFRFTEGTSMSKGLGAAIDIDYRIRVPWGKSFTTFQISGQNLGFAYLHQGLRRYETDSSYSYDGFDLDQFRDDENPLGDDFSLLDSLGIRSDTVKRAIMLPGYIQAAKLVDFNSARKLQSYFGIRLYPTFNSVPLLFAGVYWKAAKFLHASASLSYGNFGNLKGGLYATLVFDKFNWMIGTDNLVGVVARAGSGESVVTKLVWKLN